MPGTEDVSPGAFGIAQVRTRDRARKRKGGAGKSTTAMHVAIVLLKAGQRVATIDLDSRQRSCSRYFENRRAWAKLGGIDLETPTHFAIDRAEGARLDANEAAEFGRSCRPSPPPSPVTISW